MINKTILGITILNLAVGLTISQISVNSKNKESSPKILALILPKTGGPDLDLTYNLKIPQESKDKLSRDLTIYRFVSKKITEKDVIELANKLNLKGLSVLQKEGNNPQFLIKDGEKQLTINPESGTWSYNDFSKLFQKSSDTTAIADEEFPRIATAYLNKNGWLPPDFKLQAVSSVTEQADPEQPPKVLGKSAYFYRYVNGKVVYGVSRIIVDISNQGEVIGVSKYHKDFVEAGKKPLKNLDEAINQIRGKKGSITTDELIEKMLISMM